MRRMTVGTNGRNRKIEIAILLILLAVSKAGNLNFSRPITAYAKTEDVDIEGNVYEFTEKDSYDFSASEKSKTDEAYGTLKISGNIADISDNDGVETVSVKKSYDEEDGENLAISYTYSDDLLNSEDSEWHLVDDGIKKIETISLEEKMGKGVLILQTSLDRKIWVTDYVETNLFENTSNRQDAFYNITDVQITNGCYYRVIAAYKVGKKMDPTKILFFSRDNYEYKRVAEVYTFYIYDETAGESTLDSNTKKYNLGSKTRTEKYDGYYGETAITKNDPHYGWELGQFFISGYTADTKDLDGNVIFLKNVGDQVTLWFNLQQDINCLNGKETLTIMEDTAGSDQYFETLPTDFGHGALIVRKTNYENVTEKPMIYTNYLEAVASVGANTKVSLFEEGDYEVALDYGVNYDKTKVFGHSFLPKQAHYRIYFKFSVRNSNSMFFPRDIKTNSELADNAIAPDGFYLDLANSKYLQLNVVKEVLKEDGTWLSLDVRKNSSAKDGDEYIEEGIYTITVTNQYTGEPPTTKKIYVGQNDIIKAYMLNGLPIGEIQNKLAQGATIDDDGTIVMPDDLVRGEKQERIDTQEDIKELFETEEAEISENDKAVDLKKADEKVIADSSDEYTLHAGEKNNFIVLIPISVMIIAAVAYIIFIKNKRFSRDMDNKDKKGDQSR